MADMVTEDCYDAAMALSVTLLGTGSPIPDPNRAGPATLVRGDGLALLVDCGRGVLMRLAAAGLFPPGLDALLLTHLHSDHISDLSDVITSHWVMSQEPRTLRIVGPIGTSRVVEATLESLRHDVGYRIAHHDDLVEGPQVDVVEVQPGDTFEVGGATLRVGATDHRPVEPTVAYRVEHQERTVVLGGDGVPCDTLTELCRDADAYVQTVIREDLVALVPSARLQDILDYHSSVADAGRTASAAGVGTLVLTHYVPPLQPGQEDEWRARAAEHFDGPIVLGDDLTTVEL
jgi:ribonuclease Z